ncbi:MAG: type III-A CRISPR-associated RAMP protein Csm3 [Melioribacteraceae bacterium]|nr:type III-A CRISPR-associated RAMP protein Csm3 [Melioribacteraceae bacterium]
MKKKKLNISIKILTGLHIGVGSDRPEIGGIDNPFIKDPVSTLPYIPGSSLKGKLRCLLETESDNFNGENDPVIKKYFGGDDDSPTRLIFRDIKLSDEYLERYSRGELQTEIKTEIKIDRTKGTAAPGALRTTERIPPGTVFAGDLLIRYLNEDELKSIEKMIKEAVELLNNDYLGGSGSRGYGAVQATLN